MSMENENITRIMLGEKEIILIATAHVSKESAELVRETILLEKPDSVCIELDDDRYENMKNPKAWEQMDIIKVIKSGKVGFLLANLVLSSYQKRMAKKLETNVGAEMVEGIKAAEEVGAQLVMADRKIQTTFMRIWRKLTFWEKCKMLAGIIADDDEEEITDETINDMLKSDMLTAAVEMVNEELPKVGEILISERDTYLAYKIKNAPGKKVVAVLGGAHVPGICSQIDTEIDIEEISTTPPRSAFSKAIGWILPLSIIALLVVAFMQGFDTGVGQLKNWFLITGTSAAILTALTLPHPLSILVAFVTAPFTTLNPLLACGWFVGIAEATLRKPTVQDIQNVHEDIFSIKGFLGNRFLKTLLIVIMANIGSSMGTFIAGSNLLRNIL